MSNVLCRAFIAVVLFTPGCAQPDNASKRAAESSSSREDHVNNNAPIGTATIEPPFPGSRILVQHIADRACIGHCFSYGNYEPASAQFRVRATPRNLYAMSSFDDTVNMEDGSYEMQPADLPAYQVYQCSPDGKQLCIRPLAAGEMNDDLGVHPDDE